MLTWFCAPFTAVRIRVRTRRMGKDCACLFVVLVPVFTVRIRVRIRRMARIALVSPWSWCSFARCVPCCRSQALMPCIMAGMDQKHLFMVVLSPVVCRLHKTVESPQLQFFFCSSSSCRGADADSHGPSPQSFPSCSTLIWWSTFAVQLLHVRCVQQQMLWSMTFAVHRQSGCPCDHAET